MIVPLSLDPVIEWEVLQSIRDIEAFVPPMLAFGIFAHHVVLLLALGVFDQHVLDDGQLLQQFADEGETAQRTPGAHEAIVALIWSSGTDGKHDRGLFTLAIIKGVEFAKSGATGIVLTNTAVHEIFQLAFDVGFDLFEIEGGGRGGARADPDGEFVGALVVRRYPIRPIVGIVVGVGTKQVSFGDGMIMSGG